MRSASISRERWERAPSALTCIVLVIAAITVEWTGHARTPEAQTGMSAGASKPTFKSATELVALQVSVADQRGRFVPDLRLEDFAVYEEGVQQPLTFFTTASAPLDLMLLLDTSSSMSEQMQVVQEAAINFVRTLRPDDRAAVTLFSDRVVLAQSLTRDQTLLEKAIRHGLSSGTTLLNEALYVSLRELQRSRRTDDTIRRQALILLSDGDDTSTKTYVTFDDVLDAVRRSAVTVFTIVPSSYTAWETLAERRREAAARMNTLAQDTGGRQFMPSRIEDLAGTYQRIADELSQQYWLAYVPPKSSGGFRRISVKVPAQPALVARTRSGYYSSATRARVPDRPTHAGMIERPTPTQTGL